MLKKKSRQLTNRDSTSQKEQEGAGFAFTLKAGEKKKIWLLR